MRKFRRNLQQQQNSAAQQMAVPAPTKTVSPDLLTAYGPQYPGGEEAIVDLYDHRCATRAQAGDVKGGPLEPDLRQGGPALPAGAGPATNGAAFEPAIRPSSRWLSLVRS